MADSGQKLRIIPLGGVDEFGKNTILDIGKFPTRQHPS